MKKIITIVLILMAINSFSQEVSIETAKKAAINLCRENMTETNSKIEFGEIKTFSIDGIPALYILNLKNNAGFIIVSASMRSLPILGYDFEASFDFDNIPASVTDLIENYKEEIQYLNNNNIAASAKTNSAWQYYLNDNFTKGNILKASLASFHKIYWNQSCYYNENCPTDANSGSGYCGHVPTGCGATVMSEVMRYYNFPKNGLGSNTYIPLLYPLQPQSADFGSTTYNWSKMPYSINASNAEIAQIMSHTGISVSMQYSANGSGALHADVADAWINHFKYSPNLVWLKKSDYSVDSVWEELIKDELDSLRPVFYYGTKSGGTIFDGHYFILDGYSNDNYFHINWGWGGSDNGYFYLNALTPSGSNFNQDQQFIKWLKPTGPFCIDKKYTASSGSFNDGSGTGDYFDDGDCSYTIQVSASIGIHVHFTAFDVAAEDTLYIYNGLNNSAPLLAKYSGNSIPDDVTSTAGRIYLNFVTDGITTAPGWTVTYHSLYSGIEEGINNSFSVYPNPCTNNFNISFNEDIKGKINLSILDITGRIIKSQTIIKDNQNTDFTVSIPELNSGIYLLKIENNGSVNTKKINIIK